MPISFYVNTKISSIVFGSLLLNSNLLHNTLCFEVTLCITVIYYIPVLEGKVTSNILY